MLNRLVYCCLLLSLPLHAAWQGQLSSPDERLSTRIELDDQGQLWFQIYHEGEAVIQPSPLGVALHNTGFEQDLTLESASAVQAVTDSYRMWAGKRKQIEYRANEIRLTLHNRAGHVMVLALRLSDDGLAYRYEFAGTSEDTRVVVAERSGVHFFAETRAWLQPKAEAQSGWKNVNPSYEEDYFQDIAVGTPAPTGSGWVFPALFRFGAIWILLSETGMDGNYAGSNLAQPSEDGLYRLRFPQPPEVITNGKLLPEARLPFYSPWRLVLVGDLATVMQSTLGTDLAEPSRLDYTGFIAPGAAAWSWGLLKDDATVYPVQKEFIDYAAWMNWPYVLVDADWDQKIGYERIGELAEYAAGRGVGLLLWYNSSGAWNETVYSPKSRLLTRADRRAEFARLRSMGIRGVKVDFFPGDGASVMHYCRDILQDAAEFELMVNFHGATLPRGLHRTFPNLVTVEAVKGLEFITFFQENADREATHAAMLPFTRNLFDPMDFTPMVLGDIPNIERKTSNGFQLALPVLFTSGIQHLVTTPEQMRQMPDFVQGYLRQLPGQWDESRFLDGYPGKFVVIARRAGERWYVAGINAEPGPKALVLDLSFIPAATGRLITDGEQPRELQLSAVTGGRQELTLAPASGFVMLFDPSERGSHD
jgi:hypothetical protein